MAYKSKDRLRAERCMKEGVCMGCRKQKESDRMHVWYCKHCAYLKRKKQRDELKSSRLKQVHGRARLSARDAASGRSTRTIAGSVRGVKSAD